MEATGSRRLSAIARHLVLHPAQSTDSSTSSSGFPVVIGAMVADIHSYPSTPLSSGTTVIGQVRYCHGGVGRNVAECMAKLGVAPFLISVVGDDMAGNVLVEHWRSLGLEISGIRRCRGVATPVISLVFDTNGEVAAGVADTEAVETHLTPEWISRFVTVIQAAPVVLLDANLSRASLETACKLAKQAHVPVWLEPVSVSKSVRATGLYQYLTYVSPNEKELVAMGEALVASTSYPGSRDSKAELQSREERSIELLLQAGVQHVVVTLGSRGSIACTRRHSDGSEMIRCLHVPALAARVVSLSGAGDCLVAGCIAWLASTSTSGGGDVVACLAHGTATAKQAVESRLNVPEPDMTSVAGDAEAARGGARELGSGECRDMLLAYACRE